MPSDRDPVIMFSGNSVECAFVKSLLEGNGIHAFLQDEFMGMYYAGFAPTASPIGGVKVIVALADAEAAARLVEDYLKNRA
jgi:hypothetical protein